MAFTERDLRYYTKNNIDCGSVIWMGDAEYAQMMNRIRQLKRQSSGEARKMAEEYERMIAHLIEDNKKIKRVLEQTTRSFDQALKDERETIREENRRLDSQIRELESEIQEANQAIDRVNETLHEAAREQRHQTESARQLLSEAISSFNEMSDDDYCVKFRHSSIKRICYLFSKMEQELDPGAVQGLAISILGDIKKIRTEVDHLKRAFEAEYALALKDILRLETKIKQYRDAFFFDSERQHQVDLDFWTGQSLVELERGFADVRDRIEGNMLTEGYDIDEVQYDRKALKDISDTVDKIAEEAYRRGMASEAAQAAGEIAMQVLVEQFRFRRVNCGFDNDDPRGVYSVQMENLSDGRKIELFFKASKEEVFFTYRISLSSYMDQDLMTDFLRHFSEELPDQIRLDARNDVNHIDSDITFSEGTGIRISDDTKRKFGLTTETTNSNERESR